MVPLLMAAAALIAGITTGPTSAIADGPDPNAVYIQSISYGGTGCPQGSVGSSVANDRTSFTLIFDSFVASSGPGVPVTESRKNCQLNLNIHVPAGMSLADATFDYRGYVQLPAGVNAEEGSAYYLDGNPIDDASSSFTGPVARDYLSRDSLALDLSASCEERVVTVNIDREVRLQGTPASQAQITNDSLDGKITGTTQPCGPVTKDDCKKGGWQTFVGAPGPFKNQGDCVSYVATGGKNKGQGN